jgi:glycosyltransferase involved in cell wall biosynthesis
MNYFNIDSVNIINQSNENVLHDTGVSILIPVYNGIEYLEESVGSVLKQTHKKWQLIIGINGHSENSEVHKKAYEIVEKTDYDKKCDILVKVYDTMGKAKTLNAMVSDAKYDYIAILDVDDYWVDDKLESQVPFLNIYDVIGGKCEYFGSRSGSPPIPLGDFTNTHNIFNYNPMINSSAIIHKRDAIWDDENYVRSVRGLDDYSMWFKLYFLKRRFYNIDKVLCHHRIHDESAFNTVNDNNVNELKQLWYDYYKRYGSI